jgi:hypothetical protein
MIEKQKWREKEKEKEREREKLPGFGHQRISV